MHTNIYPIDLTDCRRSSYPFYVVNYYIKWVITFWTHSIKGAIYRVYIGGPRNRLQLRETSYSKRFYCFRSLWPIQSMLWCNGVVQNDPPVTGRARLDSPVTPNSKCSNHSFFNKTFVPLIIFSRQSLIDNVASYEIKDVVSISF